MLVQRGQTGRGSGPIRRRGREYRRGRRRTGRGRVLWPVQTASEVGRRRHRRRRRRRRSGRRTGRRLRLRRHLRLALVTRRHQPVKVELVRVPLAVNFRHDVLVIIVPVNIHVCNSFRRVRDK